MFIKLLNRQNEDIKNPKLLKTIKVLFNSIQYNI